MLCQPGHSHIVSWTARKGVYVFCLSQPGREVIRGEPLGAIRILHANTRSYELRSPGSIPNSRFQEDSRAIWKSVPLITKHVFPRRTEGLEALLVHADILTVLIWLSTSYVSSSLMILALTLCL